MGDLRKEQMEDPDFIIETHGSVWTFQPMTEKAKNFTATDLDVNDWQWLGPKFGVEARIANDLVSALEDEQFILQLN